MPSMELTAQKDSTAREHSVVYIEVGVFGGGGDQRDGAVLDELEKALLLLFVEVLDLVEVEQDAVGRHQRADLVDDRADVR